MTRQPSTALALSACISVLALGTTHAAPITWSGSADTLWSNDGNWDGTGGIASGDSVVFDALSTANLGTQNDLSGLLVEGIDVSDPAGNVTITGNPFTLGSGGIALTGSRDLSIALDDDASNVGPTGELIIGGDQTWNVATGRTLTMSSLASQSVGGSPVNNTILITGGGVVDMVTDQVSDDWAGTIHVRDSVLETHHDLGGDPNNSLGSGTFILENARLDLDGNKNAQDMPIDLEVLGDSTIRVGRGGNTGNTVNYSADNLTIGDATLRVREINPTGSTRLLTIDSGVSFTGTPTFDIADGNVSLSFTASVTSTPDANGLVKVGSGSLDLWANNDLGGPAVVKEGLINLYSTGGLGGASGQLILDGGGVRTLKNANFAVQTPVDAFGDSAIITRVRGGDRNGALHSYGELAVHGSTLTLSSTPGWTSGTSRIGFGGTETTLAYGGNTFIVDRNGANAFRVDLADTWLRQNRATAHINVVSSLTDVQSNPTGLSPDGVYLPAVTMQVQADPVQFARLDAGNIVPVASYTNLPTTGGSDTTAFELTGGATLTGDVDAFLLRAEATAAGQSLDLGGQTLAVRYAGGSAGGAVLFTGADAYELANGTVASGGNELIVHQYNAGGTTISADLDLGAGGLTKTGTGDLILNTAQTFTGDVTVNQGVLSLQASGSLPNANVVRLGPDGTLDLAGVTGSAYALSSGQTLAGNGTVAMGGTDLTLDGTVSPGFSVGGLTFLSSGGNLDLSSTGTLVMEIASLSGDDHDRLLLDGLQFTAGGTLELVNAFSETPQIGTTLQLFETRNATFAGQFDQILNTSLSGGLVWDTSNLLIDGTITIAIPEPATFVLLLGGSLALLRRRGVGA